MKDYKKVIEILRKEAYDYFSNAKLNSVVLGVSGGIDSALVAALLRPVCDDLNIHLIGRSITIDSNKPDEIQRAEDIGRCFCTNFEEINLTQDFFTMKGMDAFDFDKPLLDDSKSFKIRMGNIKARMRMIYLYNLASKHKGLVLSTDNLTEYYLGFWTLHGDVGDFGLIQNLWKTEVYEMSEWLVKNEVFFDESKAKALQSCIDAVATDGLGITSSDLDQILPDWKDNFKTSREGYAEVDNILKNYIGNKFIQDLNVISRMKASEFKRNNPYVVSREKYTAHLTE